jgi:hypothetical protein
MLFNILALISLLIILMMLRRLVEVVPSLIACLFRWKESINLETSVQLSISRNFLALTMFIPFCLVIWRFELYRPAFLNEFTDDSSLGITIGVFSAFALLRKALEFVFRPKKSGGKTFGTACRSSRTFLSVLTIILMAMGGVMTFVDATPASITSAMLWVSAYIYLMFILRKFQILISSASFFAAFLYLCALEIVPTGAIIASAIIF